MILKYGKDKIKHYFNIWKKKNIQSNELIEEKKISKKAKFK